MKFSKLIEAHIEAQKTDNVVLCPLCEGEMQHNGVAWFCRDRDTHEEWLYSRREAAFRYQANGGVVFFVDLRTPPKFRFENWDPNMQGVILAVTPDGWQFATVRGHAGVTNFRVTAPQNADLSNPPTPADWVWAEWTL